MNDLNEFIAVPGHRAGPAGWLHRLVSPLVSAQGSGGGSLLLQKPLGKRERTHAHSPVSGVQAKVAA
jgi:hypothetical protein